MAAEADLQAQEKLPEPSREEDHGKEPSREDDDDGKEKALPRLRRLGLVRIVAARAVVCLVALYGLAKSRAGTHRPKVDTVESVVGRVVGPVYTRFQDTPLAFLFFLDRKVDDMVHHLDRKLRSCMKAALLQACAAARAVLEAAKEFIASGAAGDYVKKVAQIAVPIALQLAEKYNRAVAGRLPPIPIKLIAKFFTDHGVEVTHEE
uniref:Uncharacterized protein n=1 Tax=Avena sativa TaxID=4498 RepID=A0ACD5WY48_AVESA